MGADVVIAIATVVLAAARPCPRTFAERTRRGYRDELSDPIEFLTAIPNDIV